MRTAISKHPSALGEITLVTLTNAEGAFVVLSSIGAGINRICVSDRRGNIEDVCLGYAEPSDYIADDPCAGKTPGRFANRIAGGRFCIGDKEYRLAINNPPNALHGGPNGFHNRNWHCEVEPEGIVRFSIISPDGEEGYPGTLKATVEYRWTDDNTLHISYSAETDAPTIVNLTNHAYFNLAGADSGSVLNQLLAVNADKWLETDLTDIPTGRVLPVADSPMDFRALKAIGSDIGAKYSNLREGKGYNHFFLIRANGGVDGLRMAARLVDPPSGRQLYVLTDAPGVMLYTGNWLDGSPLNRSGRRYSDHDGVAIECQAEPDSPNHPGFTDTTLRPGEIFSRRIAYHFSTI